MKNEKKLTFEEAIDDLEKIVEELEKGDQTLDDSVEKFKKGMELSKFCSNMLDEAEKSITILLKDKDGNIEEEKMD